MGRNKKSDWLPALGRKIFLLLADVEVALNPLKILHWLVNRTERQCFLAF